MSLLNGGTWINKFPEFNGDLSMNRYLNFIFIISCLLLLFTGCFGTSPTSDRIRFYTLEYDPPLFSGLEELPYVIRIERFSIDPIYNTNRIIYRDESYRRDEYVYYRWRSNPALCRLARPTLRRVPRLPRGGQLPRGRRGAGPRARAPSASSFRRRTCSAHGES